MRYFPLPSRYLMQNENEAKDGKRKILRVDPYEPKFRKRFKKFDIRRRA